MKIRLLTILTGISALLIAACAAYFSVTGLGLLFSGATTQVIVMASALELGKLVAASYLHNYWKDTNSAMRTYMIIGVIMLITITSAGIFGFLSNAYTQTQINVSQVDSKIELYESQKDRFEADIPRWETRINTLTENRTRQEERYNELVAGENWQNARVTSNLINESNIEINNLNNQINAARASVDSLDQLIFQVKKENIDVEREIGGFRFVAQAFNMSVDQVVKWFIIILIFIFDPMAVLLVLAFNNALAVDRKNSTLSTANDSVKSNRYKIYGDVVDEKMDWMDDIPEDADTFWPLTPDDEGHPLHILNKKQPETSAPEVEEIVKSEDEDTSKETNDNVSGLRVHTAGGDVIKKPKYKKELEAKGIPYEEIK